MIIYNHHIGPVHCFCRWWLTADGCCCCCCFCCCFWCKQFARLSFLSLNGRIDWKFYFFLYIHFVCGLHHRHHHNHRQMSAFKPFCLYLRYIFVHFINFAPLSISLYLPAYGTIFSLLLPCLIKCPMSNSDQFFLPACVCVLAACVLTHIHCGKINNNRSSIRTTAELAQKPN